MCEQALSLRREVGDHLNKANTQGNLGTIVQRQGHFEWAITCHHQALDVARAIE